MELEPVRHRSERRVRAYLSVCMLALRLQSALHQHLIEGGVKEDEVTEYQERLLEDLGRVEVRLGNEAKTWYLNVTDRGRATSTPHAGVAEGGSETGRHPVGGTHPGCSGSKTRATSSTPMHRSPADMIA